jgi:hypothetical protein
MRRKIVLFALLISLCISPNSQVIAAEQPFIYPIDERTGDSVELTWSTNFKKTGTCKKAWLQFSAKRTLGDPPERLFSVSIWMYSSNFLDIREKFGYDSPQFSEIAGRVAFDFVGAANKSNIKAICIQLPPKNWKSPLKVYALPYSFTGAYKNILVGEINF